MHRLNFGGGGSIHPGSARLVGAFYLSLLSNSYYWILNISENIRGIHVFMIGGKPLLQLDVISVVTLSITEPVYAFSIIMAADIPHSAVSDALIGVLPDVVATAKVFEGFGFTGL